MIVNSDSMLLGSKATTPSKVDFFTAVVSSSSVTPNSTTKRNDTNTNIKSPVVVSSCNHNHNHNPNQKTPPQSPVGKQSSFLLSASASSTKKNKVSRSPFQSKKNKEPQSPSHSKNLITVGSATPHFSHRSQSSANIDSGTHHANLTPKDKRRDSSGLAFAQSWRSNRHNTGNSSTTENKTTDPMPNEYSSAGGRAPVLGRHENNHLLGFDPLLTMSTENASTSNLKDHTTTADTTTAITTTNSTTTTTRAEMRNAGPEDQDTCKTPTRGGSRGDIKNTKEKMALTTSPGEHTPTPSSDHQLQKVFTKKDEEENFRSSELLKIAKEFGTPQREKVKSSETNKKRGIRRSKSKPQLTTTPNRGSSNVALPAAATPTTPNSTKSGRRIPWQRRKNNSKSPVPDILAEVQIQNVTATGMDLLGRATDLLDQPNNTPADPFMDQPNSITPADPFLPPSFQKQESSQQYHQQQSQQQQQQQQAYIPVSPFRQPTSPMIQDLLQVMSQSESGGEHQLVIPSLAKPSPTSFLTGKEVIRSSEADPSLFQLEIPDLSEFIVNSRLCQFLDQYRKEDLNMDLNASLVGVPRMALQAFLTQGIVPSSSLPLVDNHKPIVESLLECADDVTLATFFQQTNIKGGMTVDDRREVAIFERQRQFIVAFRGTTSQQQGKIFKNKKSSNAVPLDAADPSIQVFSCLKDSYMDLESRLFKCLDQITEDNPFCEIVFTGHSFGGGMATLAAYRYAIVRSVVLVQCHVFGSPRVGTQEFRSSVNSLPNLKVMRVECGNDTKCATPSDGCHVGHSVVVSGKGNAINAYKFDEGNFNKHRQSKHIIGFKKERDVGAYVTAMEEIEKRCIPWVVDFVGEGVGDGVLGKNAEKRRMV